jgi:hypothetical protein
MIETSKEQMQGILKRMQDPLASPSEKATANINRSLIGPWRLCSTSPYLFRWE